MHRVLFLSSGAATDRRTGATTASPGRLVISSGSTNCLRAHYDLDSIAALDQAWRESPAFTLPGMMPPERQPGE